MIPVISKAWVVSQDPDNEAVNVSLGGAFGGQGPTLSCQVLTQGPRDGVVGKFPALPTQGTHGIVAFVSQDSRNGVWLGAVSTQLTDASAHAPGNGAADYAAHYGGGWSWLDQDGSRNEVFPDGTVIQIGPTLHAPTRHTLDGSQARQRTAFTAVQRRPQTPSPFPLTLTSPTGASASLSASGAWAVVAAPGQTVSLSVSGGVTLILDGSGNLTVSSDVDVNINSSTAVNIAAPVVTMSGNLQVSGSVIGGFGGGDQIGLLTHRHGTGTNAAGTVPPSAGT